MLHFVMTGFYAGLVACGAERNDTDEYQHPCYNKEGFDLQLSKACPACYELYRDGDD